MFKAFIGAGLALFCGAVMADPISAAVAAVSSFLGTSGTAAAMGAVGSAVGKKLFSSKAPTPSAPKAMPAQDDAAMEAAKRRQIAEFQTRGGRASTILSQDEKLGG